MKFVCGGMPPVFEPAASRFFLTIAHGQLAYHKLRRL
jgi:hypothetical protein